MKCSSFTRPLENDLKSVVQLAVLHGEYPWNSRLQEAICPGALHHPSDDSHCFTAFAFGCSHGQSMGSSLRYARTLRKVPRALPRAARPARGSAPPAHARAHTSGPANHCQQPCSRLQQTSTTAPSAHRTPTHPPSNAFFFGIGSSARGGARRFFSPPRPPPAGARGVLGGGGRRGDPY